MKRKYFLIIKYAAIIVFPLLVSSCVNSDYDISKDIDATMGLGTSGLTLKFGNTEKIFLRDLLKVSDNNMLDTTATSLYFLVKDGEIHSDVSVDKADPVLIDPVTVHSQSSTIPATATYPKDFSFTAQSKSSGVLSISVKNLEPGLKEVATVTPNNLEVSGSFSSNISGTKVEPKDVYITFPDFIYSHQLDKNHQYAVEAGKTSFSLQIDSIVFPKTGKFGEAPVNNSLYLSDNIAMSGSFTFTALQAISLHEGDQIFANLTLSFTPIELTSVSGIIDKTINPDINTIQISDDIPDFLKDDNVHLEITNPTLKIWTQNGLQWPFSLLFRASATSVKNNLATATVNLPASGSVNLTGNTDHTYYFSQAETPFDTALISNTAEKFRVPTFGKLIEKIPDNIQIDLKNGKLSINQNVLQRANFGQTYYFNMGYRLLIPLSFDANTNIVYSDSIVDLHDDLKKYESDGLKLTADVFNAVPLNLNVEVVPYDFNGHSLASEISVATETIQAATTASAVTTPISCVLTAKDPASIKKLDKLILKISSSSTSSGFLMSNQYIQLNNIRVTLTGQIVGDFN
jgi:hypothetical protein